MGTAEPIAENEAIRLFLRRASDASGRAEFTADERDAARRIVVLLGCNRAAIQLAAARAADLPIAAIAAIVERLDDERDEPGDLRGRLALAEAHRLKGRLRDAARELEAIVASAHGDTHLDAESHRVLGTVRRAQGRTRDAIEHKRRALEIFTALGDAAHRALSLGELGTALASDGRLREARACHEEALVAHRELGQRAREGAELSYLGVALHRLGRFEEARRVHRQALAIHRETASSRLEGAERLHLAYVAHQLDERDDARAGFDEAIRILDEVDDRTLLAIALVYAASLDVEAGRPESSGPRLRRALVLATEAASARHQALAQLHFADHHTALGEHDEAQRALESAEVLGRERLEPEHRAWILARLGRLSEARTIDVEDASTKLAIDLLSLAASTDLSAARAALAKSLPTSLRVRQARALLENRIARELALSMTRDARVVINVEGTRLDLGRRGPLRRVLVFLAERRVSHPGEGVSWQSLLAAGWPEERIREEAAFGRVRNAVAQLRRLGLGDALLTRDDGYLLDPSVPLRFVDI